MPRTGRALFEAGEQPLRSVDVADRQRRFDRVAVDPPDRRLAEGDAFEHLERLRQVPVGGRPSRRPRARPVPGNGSRAPSPSGPPGSAFAAASRTDSTRPAYASTYARQMSPASATDPLLAEGVEHAFRELRRPGQVAGPGRDDHAIEQDVGERRLVALLVRLLLRLLEVRTRAVEVVDVAKPLAELEDDARVDCRRWVALLERERPHRRLPVEAVAEEEVGTHARAQRRRDEAGIGVRNALEQRQRLPRGGRRLRKVDGAGVEGDGGVAPGLENGIAGVRERLLCERRRRGFAAAPVVDLDERQQRSRAQVTRLEASCATRRAAPARPGSRLRDGVARQARAGAPVAPERLPEAAAARARSTRRLSPGSRACARGGRPLGAPARPRRPGRTPRARDAALAPPGRARGRRRRGAPRGAGPPERRSTPPTRRAGGRTRSARPTSTRTSPASSAGASCDRIDRLRVGPRQSRGAQQCVARLGRKGPDARSDERVEALRGRERGPRCRARRGGRARARSRSRRAGCRPPPARSARASVAETYARAPA